MSDPVPFAATSGRAAFTLIESVLALSALVLCLAATCHLLVWMGRLSSYTDFSSRAIAIGQAKVEEMLSTSFSNLAAGSDVTNEFARCWSLDNSLGGDIQLLTVTVTWTNHGGKVSSILAKGACLK